MYHAFLHNFCPELCTFPNQINLQGYRSASPSPLQLTWTVDYNPNRPAALRGLLNLENKVKIGDVRATLVIQTLTNTAEVTLNAGTSM